MKSTQTQRFSQVPRADIPRSSFDLSFGHKTTFDAGWLIPIMAEEALPGDTFNVRLDAFGRLATPLKPLMDNMHFETFYFSVPVRLVYENWTKLHGEQENPDDSTDFLVPQLTPADPAGFQTSSLSDHFGIPTLEPSVSISSLYHRAYSLVWNEWFRDQNLQDSAVVAKGDGPETDAVYPLRRRGKRHDYFTSSLPFPQKGESVSLGIGGTADVVPHSTDPFPLLDSRNGEFLGHFRSQGTTTNLVNQIGALTSQDIKWAQTGMEVDLTTALATTVNALREAFQVQRMLERDARGGTRYPEVIQAHFNVTHPDQSWRSEYLGGGSSPINVTPVPQQTSFGGGIVGELAAIGTMSASGHGFTKSFTEHSIVLGLACVRADLTYQQGIDRKFSRRTRFDYFYPALQGLGEQEVLNKEIFVDGTAADEEVFGYQERYAEYRYNRSIVSGKFRSNDPESLDVWHLAQDFGSRPLLNEEFIEEDPPIDRTIAVPSEPHFILDTYCNFRAARPMQTYGVPGMIDHF